MSDFRIASKPTATLNGDEVILVEQNGISKKTTVDAIAATASSMPFTFFTLDTDVSVGNGASYWTVDGFTLPLDANATYEFQMHFARSEATYVQFRLSIPANCKMAASVETTSASQITATAAPRVVAPSPATQYSYLANTTDGNTNIVGVLQTTASGNFTLEFQDTSDPAQGAVFAGAWWSLRRVA